MTRQREKGAQDQHTDIDWCCGYDITIYLNKLYDIYIYIVNCVIHPFKSESIVHLNLCHR